MKNPSGRIIRVGENLQLDPNEFYFGRIFSGIELDQIQYAISYLKAHSIPYIIWQSQYLVLSHTSIIQLPRNNTEARFYRNYWSDLYGLPIGPNQTVPMWRIDMERYWNTKSIHMEYMDIDL